MPERHKNRQTSGESLRHRPGSLLGDVFIEAGTALALYLSNYFTPLQPEMPNGTSSAASMSQDDAAIFRNLLLNSSPRLCTAIARVAGNNVGIGFSALCV